jgi:hypothetical protein
VDDRRQGSPVEATYRSRLAARRGEAERLERRHATLAWLRLAIFLAAAAMVAIMGRTSPPWLVVPLLLFVPLLFIHARVLNARDRAMRAAAFYERGLARLEDRWQGSGERGERFRDPDHLYAEDLDLFGAGGLFELLTTTRTAGGENTLAGWLLAPAEPVTIRERQGAVADLGQRLDLREDLAVLGPDVQASVRTDDLTAWAAAPPQLHGTWPRFVLPLVAAVSTGLVIQWIWTAQPPDLLVPALVVQGLLALRFRHGVHHVAHGIDQREQELRVLATLMERIEREAVESPLLQALRDRLRATGHSPAFEVRRLARLVEILSSGHNQIFAPISALLLLGTQLAFAIERWRARCGPAVPQWLAAVAEYEALSALATYSAEHPEDPFPVIAEGDPAFEADALAHPLLPGATAVANDVRLGGGGWPRLLLVSGSNMSGKSTLLRTVGLNTVLAQAGGPVRARRLTLTPLNIGATLRIQDSLQAGRSRFFAEITRISQIVALTADTSVLRSDLRPPQGPPSSAPTSVLRSDLRPPQEPPSSAPTSVLRSDLRPPQRPPSSAATSVPRSDLRPPQGPPSSAGTSVLRSDLGLPAEGARPETSKTERGVLFLLDELLAGTNSHDRLQGATGILSGLVDRAAIGLATTHDLALTAIVDGLDGRATNVHFEDRFADGVLTFDYKLKPGVVQSSNALALMRAVGLDV